MFASDKDKKAASVQPTKKLKDHDTDIMEIIKGFLAKSAAPIMGDGQGAWRPGGKLLRPLVAYASALPAIGCAPDPWFWNGSLAIQLLHEASLIHDDILDESHYRRGEPSTVALHGPSEALIMGDELFALGFCAASRTGSPEFVRILSDAIRDAAVGERRQNHAAGRILDMDEYDEIVTLKSGGLFACALALSVVRDWSETAEEYLKTGRRLGRLYQMLDDLLDYCPDAQSGNPGLRDFAQGKWTWPLEELGDVAFDSDTESITRRLFEGGQDSPTQRSLRRFERESGLLRQEVNGLLGEPNLLDGIIAGWRIRAVEAVEREEAAFHPTG